MNSIGELLKSTREEKGYSLELIARETNISRSYLQALEDENYDVFPGEPYLIGFLRNYCNFLSLSPEEVITRYKNIKIQEQPAPVEALIIKRNPIPSWVVLALGGGVIAILLLAFTLPTAWSFLSTFKWQWGSSEARKTTEYNLSEESPLFENRVYVGDSLVLPLENESLVVTVKSIGKELLLTYIQGESRLRLGEEVFLDLNGNSIMDLRLFLEDISPSDPAKGVALIAERISSTSEVTSGGPVLPLGQEALAPLSTESPEALTPRSSAAAVLLEEDVARPFSLDVVFRGYAFFRFQVDDRLREEGYFQKGETIKVEALRKAVVWVSNAGSFVGRISGNDVELGRPGEVTAGVIQWFKNSATGKYQLRLEPLF